MPRRPASWNVALAAALGAGLMALGGCGSESSTTTGSPGARLLVIPEPTREAMFARVSGVLGINDRGCFTLDDRVLVVGSGSRVLDGNTTIEVADVGIVELGARAVGAGGEIDGLDEVERISRVLDLGDGVMTCQTDADAPSLTVLDPSGR